MTQYPQPKLTLNKEHYGLCLLQVLPSCSIFELQAINHPVLFFGGTHVQHSCPTFELDSLFNNKNRSIAVTLENLPSCPDLFYLISEKNFKIQENVKRWGKHTHGLEPITIFMHDRYRLVFVEDRHVCKIYLLLVSQYCPPGLGRFDNLKLEFRL